MVSKVTFIVDETVAAGRVTSHMGDVFLLPTKKDVKSLIRLRTSALIANSKKANLDWLKNGWRHEVTSGG